MNLINIRFSTNADRASLAELAELDGHAAPQGEAVLAEVNGRIVAAVGVADGVAVADPFVLTSDTLDLLRLRAEQERERTLGRGPLLGRLMLIRQRAGVIA
jgi:ketosteroid isomerase-like protein